MPSGVIKLRRKEGTVRSYYLFLKLNIRVSLRNWSAMLGGLAPTMIRVYSMQLRRLLFPRGHSELKSNRLNLLVHRVYKSVSKSRR